MLQKSSKKNHELIKIIFGSSKIDANRIVFFFGAEAYVQFGILSMTKGSFFCERDTKAVPRYTKSVC
jgi:hypothetical protein